MILLSAHKDTVMHTYRLSYSKGVYRGLLDNWIGRLVCDSLLLEEPNLALLERKGHLALFYGDSEEWGTITDLPKIAKNDIVIVVDVASGDQYKNIDFSLENIAGFEKNKIKDLKESLEWEAFKPAIKWFDGNPDDEDESWKWGKMGFKVISFIIPIENGSKNTGWHVDNCTVTNEKLVKCKQGLKRVINYLL